MSNIKDTLKNKAVQMVFDNKVLDKMSSEVKKLDVYVNVLGQLKIIGVDFGSIENDIKTIKASTEHMLNEIKRMQIESEEKKETKEK
jgi:aspartate ammonia-lyase